MPSLLSLTETYSLKIRLYLVYLFLIRLVLDYIAYVCWDILLH